MPKVAKGAKGRKDKKEKAKPQEDDGTDINLAEGRISIVGTQPDKVNKVLKKHAGAAARIFELDLTDNNLKVLPDISMFKQLKTLVIDRNHITDAVVIPALPGLQNLWANDNQLSDLNSIVAQVVKNCPNLRYLSLLKNPCCPNFLVEQAGKDLHDYQLYRYAVLFRLPGLKFLDFQAVKEPERAEAKKRGKFTAVAKPKAPGGGGDGGETAEVAAAVADHNDGTEPTGEHEARTYLGFNPYNYLGRESEGNRFITNDAL